MGRNKKYGNITLTDEDRVVLEKLSKSQTGEYRKVQRAKILLMSASGMLNCEIATAIGVHPNTVASIVTKYIAAGKDYALNDASRSGKPNTISDEEKFWVTSIACIKPNELGMRRNSGHIESSVTISAPTAKTRDILALPKYQPIPSTVSWPVMRSSRIRSIIILSARILISRRRCMTYWLSTSR